MNLLLIYKSEKSASTISDHVNAFKKYSKFNIQLLDVNNLDYSLVSDQKFDGLIIHYTILFYDENRLNPILRQLIRHFSKPKFAFKQDEYNRVNDVIDCINYLRLDVFFTCVPMSEVEKVYPKSKLPGLNIYPTLTGYVPEDLLSVKHKSYVEREVDVVYRTRKISAWYGRLGQDKWKIAEKFKEDAVRFGLKHDISYHEEDRIYGKDWIDFLSNTKSALGVESGANVFDFTGKIQEMVVEREIKYPDVSFEELERIYFPGLDGKIIMNQISPRCFECAALGTLMILYEGNYSGILKPWRHYIPLKKDHSNVAEVISALRDENKWKEITTFAYNEIAVNPLYSYKKFIEDFDRVVDKYIHKTIGLTMDEERLQFPSLDLSRTIHTRTDSLNWKGKLIFFLLTCVESMPMGIGKKGGFFRNCLSSIRVFLRPLKVCIKEYIFFIKLIIQSKRIPKMRNFFNKKFIQQTIQLFDIGKYILQLEEILGIKFITQQYDPENANLELIIDDMYSGQPFYWDRLPEFLNGCTININNKWTLPDRFHSVSPIVLDEPVETLDILKMLLISDKIKNLKKRS